jgi:tetraacyldisaccharide 4'-kinase
MTSPSRRPRVERAWQGTEPLLEVGLRLLEPLYAAGAALARGRSARTRRRVEGIRVLAIGGLEVGGSGKTSLARWAATTALGLAKRPAILLRGHRSDAASGPARLVPHEDMAEHHGVAAAAAAAAARARAFGDEAVAHRAVLPPEILVVAGRHRAEAATLARTNGADLAILDDGWEQSTLGWDSSWVVLDPLRPLANGRQLPAGPLRQPASNLRDVNAILAIADVKDELDSISEAFRDVPHPAASRRPYRFLRRLERWAPLLPASAAAEGRGPGPALLLSSVGSPARLERFLAGTGLELRGHLAFADHGSWDVGAVLEGARRLRTESGGKGAIVVSDKDAGRAMRLAAIVDLGVPVWVARTSIVPHDDPAPLLADLGGGVATSPAIR